VIANTNIFRGMAGDLIGRRETRQHREHAARTTLTSEAMTYADSERPAWYLNSQLAAATSGNSRRHEAPRRMSLIGCHAGAAVLTKSVSRLICAQGIARMSHHFVRLARVQRPTAKKSYGRLGGAARLPCLTAVYVLAGDHHGQRVSMRMLPLESGRESLGRCNRAVPTLRETADVSGRRRPRG
jgi:hypothetical protein